MKRFVVYEGPDGVRAAAKVGFSWPAFFFTWLWAFIKRLWKVGLVVLVIMSAASSNLANYGIQGFLRTLIIFGCMFYMGNKGNAMREQYMQAHGYKRTAVVEAENASQAASGHTAEKMPAS